MKPLSYHIATVLGLGDRLPAPGTTAGSLPAIVGWWMAMMFLPTSAARLAATLVGTAVVFAVGTWASAAESARRGQGDPGPVVIDEVAGQWLTMVPALLLVDNQSPSNLGLSAVVGFFFFRFFFFEPDSSPGSCSRGSNDPSSSSSRISSAFSSISRIVSRIASRRFRRIPS